MNYFTHVSVFICLHLSSPNSSTIRESDDESIDVNRKQPDYFEDGPEGWHLTTLSASAPMLRATPSQKKKGGGGGGVTLYRH